VLLISVQSFGYNRIVSLAPSITEILFKLGQGDKIVGVTVSCNYPKEAEKIDKIGSYHKPSFEKIMMLKPDLVLGMRYGDTAKIKFKLDQFNINNRFFKAGSIKEIVQLIESIGGLTKKDTSFLTEPIKSTYFKKHRINKKVLMILSADPIISIGGGVYLNDIMECAGGKNLLADNLIKFPKINIEAVYRLNPDYIIYSYEGSANSISRLKTKTEKLGMKTKFIYINPDIVNRASYRIVDACKYLREKLK